MASAATVRASAAVGRTITAPNRSDATSGSTRTVPWPGTVIVLGRPGVGGGGVTTGSMPGGSDPWSAAHRGRCRRGWRPPDRPEVEEEDDDQVGHVGDDRQDRRRGGVAEDRAEEGPDPLLVRQDPAEV